MRLAVETPEPSHALGRELDPLWLATVMVSSCGTQKLVAGQIEQREVFLPVISVTVGEEIHKASKKVGLYEEQRKIGRWCQL